MKSSRIGRCPESHQPPRGVDALGVGAGVARLDKVITTPLSGANRAWPMPAKVVDFRIVRWRARTFCAADCFDPDTASS
jgi:hypothetical protein